jgi:purine-binding chemotaxis protein CheW
MQVVCFQVGDVEYALDILRVKEVVPVPPIMRVPRLPTFMEGFIEVRGEYYPAVDMRRCLGLQGTATGRCILAVIEDRRVGLLVDAVHAVERLSSAAVAAPPTTLVGEPAAYVVGVCKVSGRGLLLIDLERLFTTAERAALRDSSSNNFNTST